MIIIFVDLRLAEFDVGLITVDMSINVTYPNLKPHLHELAELIAKELEIDSRQVLIRIKSMQQLGCAGYASGSFQAGLKNILDVHLLQSALIS